MNEIRKTLSTAIDDAEIQIWREVMAQLRHLSDDLLKGLRLFLGANAVLLVIVIILGATERHRLGAGIVCALLAVMGILLTAAGRFVLKRNRIYYLEMLAKKSLLERELGFYGRKLAGSDTDLALPWRLKPEVVAEIAENCDAWVQKSIRSKGTIARVYFLIYEVLIGVYGAAFLVALVRVVRWRAEGG